MQFYNKLKHKFQQSKQEPSQTPPTNELGLSQHKPPLVDSRQQWNTNVYLVPKWEKKDIKRVDSSLHAPFPIRNYINYVQQHSGGFQEELNLDFFKHIFRHFAINQWWIEEARKFKQSVPINILQSPEEVRQNPEYCKLMMQKQKDDLKFYQEILRNVKSPNPPFPSRQIPEYRKSITYQVLDLHAGQEHKDKSLFQLQDVFVNRIIQLISEQGVQSLGYYDYVTFKNIVQDRIKGAGDAENFVKILEIKRLFNSVDQIQKEFDKTVNEWQREYTLTSNNTKSKFRRWQQEKTLFSDELLQLASNVGLDANLVKARKNFDLNKTEQQYKELVKVGDQIQLSTHKTIMDTLSKIAQDEYNNISVNNSVLQEDALQLARVQYEEQKNIIKLEHSSEGSIPQYSEVPNSRECSDIFQNVLEQKQLNESNKLFQQPIVEQRLNNNVSAEMQKPFLQYAKQQSYKLQQKPANSSSPQRRMLVVSENNSRSNNNSNNQNNTHRVQSQGQEKMLQSQWSQQSLKSLEDIIKPPYEDDINKHPVKTSKEQPQKNSMQFYQKLDYKDSKQFENAYKDANANKNLTQNTISHHQYNIQQGQSNSHNNMSISLNNKNTSNSINDDIKLLSDFVQQNRVSQQKLKDKLFSQEKEKDELRQLQEELENISRDDNVSNFRKNTLESQDKEKSLDIQSQSRTISSKEDKKYKESIENQVKLDYGYNVPSSMPGSLSNNTTARTSRNTSNYNSIQNKRSKVDSIEEASEEQAINQQQEQAIKQQQVQGENENVRRVSPNKLTRQTSIKSNLRANEQRVDNKQQSRDSKHSRQDKSQGRDTHIQINQLNYMQDSKQDDINNYQISQQSSDLSPQKSKKSAKSPEKAKRFQKSVTKIIDSNKQNKKEQQKLEIVNKPFESQQQAQQDIRKSRHKTGNREAVDESSQEEQDKEDDEEKRNNNKFKRQKSIRKGQFHSVSMPKIGKDEDPKKYLLILKEELKELIEKKVSLREIKEHINLILSEIAGVKLDPELEYYLQLYKQRVMELTQVNQHSREIHFQTLQPSAELNIRREIKGLKFARNCDRIPKLQPKDLEDTFVLQQQSQKEQDLADQESKVQSYQPIFRYEQRPQAIQSDIIQVSLDVSRRQTPNTHRQERAGSLLEVDLPILTQRKGNMVENKRKKKTRYAGQTSIKRDKLSEDYPFLYKYKPELLKCILEARISLEKLV
ncbi:unnamed protein product (macronuclear) [Paramecium tetraurelia]|uniref:Uncharacterized protein n=1 Tax=Paramecium tetraurelia TaxID=5888 RepID=A0DUY7_PARTE|nr:uncharacterized protein GSPATT00020516001 [Paramecium tetraurelia]CAK86854.1 unnamed protein product [Paramecium tetraurelia]|eukprot:XP_001454251.1 hypothetical protein (macronuclear) [Paramecium tetraurelia strain d4-2]